LLFLEDSHRSLNFLDCLLKGDLRLGLKGKLLIKAGGLLVNQVLGIRIIQRVYNYVHCLKSRIVHCVVGTFKLYSLLILPSLGRVGTGRASQSLAKRFPLVLLALQIFLSAASMNSRSYWLMHFWKDLSM